MRSDTTGEVIFKDVLKNGATVAGILSADYRSDGRTEVHTHHPHYPRHPHATLTPSPECIPTTRITLTTLGR